jgi:hypothetical protein
MSVWGALVAGWPWMGRSLRRFAPYAQIVLGAIFVLDLGWVTYYIATSVLMR